MTGMVTLKYPAVRGNASISNAQSVVKLNMTSLPHTLEKIDDN